MTLEIEKSWTQWKGRCTPPLKYCDSISATSPWTERPSVTGAPACCTGCRWWGSAMGSPPCSPEQRLGWSPVCLFSLASCRWRHSCHTSELKGADGEGLVLLHGWWGATTFFLMAVLFLVQNYSHLQTVALPHHHEPMDTCPAGHCLLSLGSHS